MVLTSTPSKDGQEGTIGDILHNVAFFFLADKRFFGGNVEYFKAYRLIPLTPPFLAQDDL